MTDILTGGLLKLGFSEQSSAALAQQMETYIKELKLFNSAYNLVNTDDHDEIVVRHILDSLSAAAYIEQLASSASMPEKTITIGDIGSGGGLPGIPLAAALSQYKFVLVERMSKRCAFLENCCAILGLKNVHVLNSEAERVTPESIDVAVFRAFRPLDKKMIKTLLSLLSPQGTLAAYKAKKEKITQEMNAISDIVSKYEVKELYVPGLTDTNSSEERERNLVIIRKN